MIPHDLFSIDPRRVNGLFFAMFVLTLIAAIVFRLPYIFTERMWPDEALYAWYAQQLSNAPQLIFSKEIIEFHPPLFPWLLSLGHKFFPPERACRLGSLLINVVGIGVIYWLGAGVRGHFLGALASMALAFNFLYLSQGTHILSDGPMAIFCLLLVLAMTRINVPGLVRDDILVGIMGIVVVLTKWPGIIVIPFIFLYYLWAFPQAPFGNRLQQALIPVGMVSSVALAMVVCFTFLTGKIWPDMAVLKGVYLAKPFWYYAGAFPHIIIFPPLILFFIVGLLVVGRSKSHREKLLLLWFLSFFMAISVSQEKDLRYSLLILPSSLLIAGIGVDEILTRWLKSPKKIFGGQILCIFCLLIFYWQMNARTVSLLDKGEAQFTGFQEAGAWIKMKGKSAALVMAGSPRIVRYYSGIDFKEFDGNIIALPSQKEDFEKMVRDSRQPILLEVDVWERTQPAWVYPLSDGRIKYLRSVGFTLEKIVARPVGAGKRNVIWIFYRG